MIVPPALFGHELAGIIEEVGPGVKGFKRACAWSRSTPRPAASCFYCSKHQENLCEDLLFNNGAYAEYIRIPQRIVEANMLAIPEGVSFEAAAMTEPLACVLRGLHETGVEIGDTVAVIGGGPIGLMFMQVAKAIGCNVIAVVKRDEQVAAARKFGANEVVQITERWTIRRSGSSTDPGWSRRGRRDRSCRPSASLAVGDGHGPQGRNRELLRRMRQRHQGRTRHQAAALLRDHAEGDVPSHAGNRPPAPSN